MKLGWSEIRKRALRFSKKWENTSSEASEAQSFLNDFFNVFGVDRKRVATFESKVPMGERNGYIDLLWKGVILVEMKSKGKNLDKAYGQARDYAFNLEDEELPEYTMVSDFEYIKLYRNTTGQEWKFKTNKLHTKIKLFGDLAGYKASKIIPTDQEVDIKAAEKMAKLHDILKSLGYSGHNLEMYLVRILFCMFADDTGIFEKNIFFDYISNSKKDGTDLSYRIAKLFEVLDMSEEERLKQTMMSEELKRFRYINGELFREMLPLADFNENMRKILLECCSLDWGFISPAIFGSMFQGVMNPEERREMGAHYTSEENILKVIKPLFLDDLWEQFERIKWDSKQLNTFHDELADLKFLDPACGCGNFLIITYREIRLLELEVVKSITDYLEGQLVMDIAPYIKIDVDQFYGIEYEEFPAQIAQVGMWLIDHQMNTLVAEHFGLYYARLPLVHSATIVNSNALTTDWESIVLSTELNYILGNPPFVGKKEQKDEQKNDMKIVFEDWKKHNVLDYVTAWYKKSAEYIQDSPIKCAFVSTNSITHGEQVSVLWKPLKEKYNISINFAYRTFKWTNEAKGKAAIHCVIIGFSSTFLTEDKIIFDENGNKSKAENINPYLVNAPDVYISARRSQISGATPMNYGSMPIDDGALVLSEKEKQHFIETEPITSLFIRKYMGGTELINNRVRWCIWLKGVSPTDLRKSKLTLERVNMNKDFRQNSNRKATNKLADTPQLFGEIRQPQMNYLGVPKVSSENRKYIPVGILSPTIIASGSLLVVPEATLYDFGIITSHIHMTWMRTVGGRMKSDYQYSSSIVYNNFPWPSPTNKEKQDIEIAVQEVLDARALYPKSSLADLYDSLAMPSELVKAHNNVNNAVAKAYGEVSLKVEDEIISHLMVRYSELINSDD